MPADPAKTPPKPPTYLGDKARKVWRDTVADYVLRSDELRLLEDACREIDLIERLAEELTHSALMVKGSMGQLVASPLVSELRQHRMTLRALFGALRLSDEPTATGDRSTPARRAAASRWGIGGA